MYVSYVTTGVPHHKQAVLAGSAPVQPLPNSRPVHWVWNEVGELFFSALPHAKSLGSAAHAVSTTAIRLLGGVDAVLDDADPLPFLGLHYVQVRASWCLLSDKSLIDVSLGELLLLGASMLRKGKS